MSSASKHPSALINVRFNHETKHDDMKGEAHGTSSTTKYLCYQKIMSPISYLISKSEEITVVYTYLFKQNTKTCIIGRPELNNKN